MKEPDYPFTIRHLLPEDGGGFLIEFPDLPGCISDGDTIEQAIENGIDAIACWVAAASKAGREIPKPDKLRSVSGKWIQRVPKFLHKHPTQQAKMDEVSINMLVVSTIDQALGERKRVA